MDPLPSSVLKSLGDKLYDKRRNAALEIESIVKELATRENSNKLIRDVILALTTQFAYSTNAFARKGGLIGLAGTAIGLGQEASNFLSEIFPPVLKCFTDRDSRVRYYACESLYNIAKVTRGSVLQYFNEIFDGLSKLAADPDLNVKNGAQLLDRLLKDIVTESDSFKVEDFIPLLRDRIYVVNPFVRQFLVSWISVLDSVPDIDMMNYLPEFLDGVLLMLSDQHGEIRTQADSTLSEFLKLLKVTENLNYEKLIPILLNHCRQKDEFTAHTAIIWINEFIFVGGELILPFAAEIVSAILPSLAHGEENIRASANTANHNLLKLVHESSKPFDVAAIVRGAAVQLALESVNSRLAALRWILMLFLKLPADVINLVDELFPALLRTLSDEAEEVVRIDLEVISRISGNEDYFLRFIQSLMKLFSSDAQLLENRGSLIIRQLSLHLDAENIYRAITSQLENENDLEFTWVMVTTLNTILFTSPELAGLRNTLKDLNVEKGRSLFAALYKSWCHNPLAAFSLCLLSQAYEHAAVLVLEFGKIDITVAFLLEVDKLVQLLESPIFTQLRLQLVEPHKYPFLFKALYGLLMLLPQSSAFDALHRRLASVSTLTLLHLLTDKMKSSDKKKKLDIGIDFDEMTAHFNQIQRKREEARQEGMKQNQVAGPGPKRSSGIKLIKK